MKNFKAAIDRTAPACRTFVLPQVSFICDSAINMPGIGVIAGGRAPSARWLREIWCNFRFWAADSGLDICFRAQKLPERALGDFDSVSSESLAWAKRNGTIIETFPIEKDLTDLQLVLRKAACLDVSCPLLLTGCWGGRYDHMQSNVFSCLGYARQTSNLCCMADQKEALLFVKGGKSVDIILRKRPEVLSLIPFSDVCDGIYLKGTHWELQDACMSLNEPWAISNRIEISDRVQLKFNNGWLGAYLGWQ